MSIRLGSSILLDMERLDRRFNPLGTISGMDFSVGGNRIFNLMNRSNYNGAAANHSVVGLCSVANNSIVFGNMEVYTNMGGCRSRVSGTGTSFGTNGRGTVNGRRLTGFVTRGGRTVHSTGGSRGGYSGRCSTGLIRTLGTRCGPHVSTTANSRGGTLVTRCGCRLHGTGGAGLMARVRVVFRSPVTSLSPEVAIHSVVTRKLVVRNRAGGRIVSGGMCRVLRLMKLITSRTDHCPRRFSNNRHREVNITHSVVVGPSLVVTSRPISTLSISVRTRIVGLLGSLESGFNLAVLFVTRSLSMIGCFSSEVNIVCCNGVMRLTSSSRLFLGPLRPCAGSLLSTVPLPSPVCRGTEGEISCGPLTTRSCSISRPAFHRIGPNRFMVYGRTRCSRCVTVLGWRRGRLYQLCYHPGGQFNFQQGVYLCEQTFRYRING